MNISSSTDVPFTPINMNDLHSLNGAADIDSLLKEIDEETQHLLLQASALPMEPRRLAEQRIREMADVLKDKIKEMKSLGKFPEMISFAAEKGIFEIRSASDNFFEKCRLYGQNKEENRRKIDNLASDINNFFTGSDFSNLVQSAENRFPKDSLLEFMKSNQSILNRSPQASSTINEEDNGMTAKKMIEEDPLWAMKKMNVEQNMIGAEMAAGAINALVKEPLNFIGSTFCQFNPTTGKVCQVVADLSQKASDNLDKIEFLARTLKPSEFANALQNMNDIDIPHDSPTSTSTSTVRPKSEALADLLEKDFLIPRERSLQSSEDAFTMCEFLALAPIGGGIGGTVGKQVIKSIARKPIVSIAEDTLAASSLRASSLELGLSEKSISTATQPTLRNLLMDDISAVKLPKTMCEKVYDSKVSDATRAENRIKTRAHLNRIENEKFFLNERLSNTPSMYKHPSFPPTLNQFLSKSEKIHFKSQKVLDAKKGVVEGDLLYKRMDDSILYLISYRRMGIRTSGKVHSELCLKHIIEKTFLFSKEQGFKRQFLAWDPEHLPLASSLNSTQLESILTRGLMAKGVYDRPLQVIEFSLSK